MKKIIATILLLIPSIASANISLGNNLTGYWPMDSRDYISSTKIMDRSGNGYTGTFTGTPTKVAGIMGQGLSFNANQQVVTPSVTIGSWPYTFSFWFETTNGAAGLFFQWNNVFCKINQQATGKVNCSTISSSGTSATSPVATYNDGKWHMVTFIATSTATTSGQILYMDGAYSAMASQSTSTLTGAIDIGGLGTSGQIGPMDDFRMYSRQLSAAEINQLYRQGAESKGNGSIINGILETIGGFL